MNSAQEVASADTVASLGAATRRYGKFVALDWVVIWPASHRQSLNAAAVLAGVMMLFDLLAVRRLARVG